MQASRLFIELVIFSPLGLHQHWDESTLPAHLVAEIADCTALTIFNPLTIVYWVGVTSNWLPFAHSVLGYSAPGWGILMASAGLMTWFTALIVVVRFIPHRRFKANVAVSRLAKLVHLRQAVTAVFCSYYPITINPKAAPTAPASPQMSLRPGWRVNLRTQKRRHHE